ncbi:MAG: alpha-1,2-fucosyltransferase [Chitinophagales bacterium]|nr:alpha-1,2-fucosyltransferase [Chitinophagales bacterium]MCZ2392563.1 alpha-1,2-fucosyltransferase [Chitinophagales bacterium]
MIKVLLRGGLGNQMFQYAFGRALAIQNQTSLILDTSYLNSKMPFKKWTTPMKYELGVFRIDAQLEHNFFQSPFLYPLAKVESLFKGFLNRRKYDVVEELDLKFCPQYLTERGNLYVIGHFMSEKYFSAYSPIIRKELSFLHELNGFNKELSCQIAETYSVSVHIRRGDYLSIKKNKEKFYFLDLDYYHKAIHYMSEKLQTPTFFIFSDDIEWVKDNLKIDFPCIYVENNHGNNAYLDMQLMSLCKNQIIANSSFSWWAAWLNNQNNKIVIRPDRWLKGMEVNSMSLFPEEWILL